jgi:hypothetical protein
VDKLIIRDLEFRGIKRNHLDLYFKELGGNLVTECFPYIYEAENWNGQILSEEVISITSTFKVNSVRIRFIADEESILEDLIKKYRFKTTRVGG